MLQFVKTDGTNAIGEPGQRTTLKESRGFLSGIWRCLFAPCFVPMAISVLKLGQICTAAVASGDLLAVATPSHSVLLLERTSSGWLRPHEGQVLSEGHEATITALAIADAKDAADRSSSLLRLRLASSSHDRNSYVWTQQQELQDATAPNGLEQQQQQQVGRQELWGSTKRWRAELVITRLSKAGLCCAWAPGSRKFAIGSVDGLVDIVYLDASRVSCLNVGGNRAVALCGIATLECGPLHLHGHYNTAQPPADYVCPLPSDEGAMGAQAHQEATRRRGDGAGMASCRRCRGHRVR